MCLLKYISINVRREYLLTNKNLQKYATNYIHHEIL